MDGALLSTPLSQVPSTRARRLLPPSSAAAPAAAALLQNWNWLGLFKEKKKKGEGEGIRAAARERAIESTFLQLPWVSFPHSLLFSNTKSPKLNPEQLFPSVQFPSLPLSHTRQEESPFFLLISLRMLSLLFPLKH